MPLYEFKCKNCEKFLELIVKISDPLPQTCQYCGQDTLEKQLSKTSFILKGQGWYETDFKQKPKSQEKSTSKVSESGSETSAPTTEPPKTDASAGAGACSGTPQACSGPCSQ